MSELRSSKGSTNRAWWLMLINPAPMRHRPEEHLEFKISLLGLHKEVQTNLRCKYKTLSKQPKKSYRGMTITHTAY